MANQLDDIDFLQPDLAEDFVKLMRAYYQRQYAHTIVSDEREADTLPFLMEHAFGQKTYELAKLFTPLISSHDRSLWIEDSPNQKELDKILMNASFDHLDIRDLEYVWHYFRSFIQSKQVASEYGLKLMHTFIDLGEMIRTHE